MSKIGLLHLRCPNSWIHEFLVHGSIIPLLNLLFPVFPHVNKCKHKFLIFFQGKILESPLAHLLFLLPTVEFYHQTLRVLFSNYSQSLVTSYHFHHHQPCPGRHCLLPKLLQWLLNHSPGSCPCSKFILHRSSGHSE